MNTNSVSKKLDVFEVLTAIESKNIKFFDSLSHEQQKAFAPIVVQRWLTGNEDALQVYQVNNSINKYVFVLHKEPKLLYQLMVASASGKKHRNQWITKKTIKNNIVTKLVSSWLQCSMKEASTVQDQYTVDDVLEIADNLGWNKEELTKLKKALTTTND